MGPSPCFGGNSSVLPAHAGAGRVIGGYLWQDQGRSSRQEGPAEEGGGVSPPVHHHIHDHFGSRRQRPPTLTLACLTSARTSLCPDQDSSYAAPSPEKRGHTILGGSELRAPSLSRGGARHTAACWDCVRCGPTAAGSRTVGRQTSGAFAAFLQTTMPFRRDRIDLPVPPQEAPNVDWVGAASLGGPDASSLIACRTARADQTSGATLTRKSHPTCITIMDPHDPAGTGALQFLPVSPVGPGPQLGAAPGSAACASPGAVGAAFESAPPTAADDRHDGLMTATETPGTSAPSETGGVAVPEVDGSTLTLLEEIGRGTIEVPGLLSWVSWLRWGGGAGRAPPPSPDEPSIVGLQRESILWETTMSHVYGRDWRLSFPLHRDEYVGPLPSRGRSLESATTPLVPPGAQPAAPAGVGGTLGGARVSACKPETSFLVSSHSVGPSQELEADKSTPEVLRTLQEDCGLDQDSPEEYETALVRLGSILGLQGEPLDPKTIARVAIRASYQTLVIGQKPEEACKTLQARLFDVFRPGRAPPDAITRAGVLLDLLSLHDGGVRTGEHPFGCSAPPTVAIGIAGGVSMVPQTRPATSIPCRTAGVGEEEPAPFGPVSGEWSPVTMLSKGPPPSTGEAALFPQSSPSAVGWVDTRWYCAQKRTSDECASEGPVRGSTIEVSSPLRWPAPDGPVNGIPGGVRACESACGLADGFSGISPWGSLAALGTRLKRHHDELGRETCHAASPGSRLASGPWKVRDGGEAILSPMEVIAGEGFCRSERNRLKCPSKGKLSARQFRSVFQQWVRESADMGSGKPPRGLLTEYLRRVGKRTRQRVLAYRFVATGPDGQTTIRSPETWLEAHAVLVELEGRDSHSNGPASSVGAASSGLRSHTGGAGMWNPGVSARQKGARGGATTRLVLSSALGLDRNPARAVLRERLSHFDEVGARPTVNPQDGDSGAYHPLYHANLGSAVAPRPGADSLAIGGVSSHYAVGLGGRGSGEASGSGRRGGDDRGGSRPPRRPRKGDGGKGGPGGRPPQASPSGQGSRKRGPCHAFLRGRCTKGFRCEFSHSLRTIGSSRRALAAWESVPIDLAEGLPSEGADPSEGPTASGSGLASTTVSGPFSDSASGRPTERGPSHALRGTLSRLGMGFGGLFANPPLAAGSPPGGAASGGPPYRTYVQFVDIERPLVLEALLDTLSPFPLVGEETVCAIHDYAVQSGRTPGDEEWPLRALEYWGSPHSRDLRGAFRAIAPDNIYRYFGETVPTSTAPSVVVGRTCLSTIFIGIDGRRVAVPVCYGVLRKGSLPGRTVILGGATLEPSPAGLGFEPRPTCHYLSCLDLSLPRLDSGEGFGPLLGGAHWLTRRDPNGEYPWDGQAEVRSSSLPPEPVCAGAAAEGEDVSASPVTPSRPSEESVLAVSLSGDDPEDDRADAMQRELDASLELLHAYGNACLGGVDPRRDSFVLLGREGGTPCPSVFSSSETDSSRALDFGIRPKCPVRPLSGPESGTPSRVDSDDVPVTDSSLPRADPAGPWGSVTNRGEQGGGVALPLLSDLPISEAVVSRAWPPVAHSLRKPQLSLGRALGDSRLPSLLAPGTPGSLAGLLDRVASAALRFGSISDCLKVESHDRSLSLSVQGSSLGRELICRAELAVKPSEEVLAVFRAFENRQREYEAKPRRALDSPPLCVLRGLSDAEKIDLDFAIRGRQRLAEGLLKWRSSGVYGERHCPLDRGARPVCDGARGNGRPLCQRCRRQRPASRIRCLSCARRVGPGCTPGCLLVEVARVGVHRRGLCMDWPYCGSSTPEDWVQGARDVLPSAGLRVPTPPPRSQRVFVGSTNFTTSSMANAELTAQIVLSPTGLQQVSEWFQYRWASLNRRRGLGEPFYFSVAAVTMRIVTWIDGLEPGLVVLPAVPNWPLVVNLAPSLATGASTKEDSVCFCCADDNPRFHCEFCGQKYCEDCYDTWDSRCWLSACRDRGRRAPVRRWTIGASNARVGSPDQETTSGTARSRGVILPSRVPIHWDPSAGDSLSRVLFGDPGRVVRGYPLRGRMLDGSPEAFLQLLDSTEFGSTAAVPVAEGPGSPATVLHQSCAAPDDARVTSCGLEWKEFASFYPLLVREVGRGPKECLQCSWCYRSPTIAACYSCGQRCCRHCLEGDFVSDGGAGRFECRGCWGEDYRLSDSLMGSGVPSTRDLGLDRDPSYGNSFSQTSYPSAGVGMDVKQVASGVLDLRVPFGPALQRVPLVVRDRGWAGPSACSGGTGMRPLVAPLFPSPRVGERFLYLGTLGELPLRGGALSQGCLLPRPPEVEARTLDAERRILGAEPVADSVSFRAGLHKLIRERLDSWLADLRAHFVCGEFGAAEAVWQQQRLRRLTQASLDPGPALRLVPGLRPIGAGPVSEPRIGPGQKDLQSSEASAVASPKGRYEGEGSGRYQIYHTGSYDPSLPVRPSYARWSEVPLEGDERAFVSQPPLPRGSTHVATHSIANANRTAPMVLGVDAPHGESVEDFSASASGSAGPDSSGLPREGATQQTRGDRLSHPGQPVATRPQRSSRETSGPAGPGGFRDVIHALTGNHLGIAADRSAARYVAANALEVPEPFVVLLSMWPVFRALATRPAARIKFRNGGDGPYVRQLPAIYATQVDPRDLYERFIQIAADNSVVQDDDLAMHKLTKCVRRIDYFHGFHKLVLLDGRTAAAPIAQMVGRPKEDWFAHDIIRADSRRPGPVYRAMVTLQRRFRERRRFLLSGPRVGNGVGNPDLPEVQDWDSAAVDNVIANILWDPCVAAGSDPVQGCPLVRFRDRDSHARVVSQIAEASQPPSGRLAQTADLACSPSSASAPAGAIPSGPSLIVAESRRDSGADSPDCPGPEPDLASDQLPRLPPRDEGQPVRAHPERGRVLRADLECWVRDFDPQMPPPSMAVPMATETSWEQTGGGVGAESASGPSAEAASPPVGAPGEGSSNRKDKKSKKDKEKKEGKHKTESDGTSKRRTSEAPESRPDGAGSSSRDPAPSKRPRADTVPTGGPTVPSQGAPAAPPAPVVVAGRPPDGGPSPAKAPRPDLLEEAQMETVLRVSSLEAPPAGHNGDAGPAPASRALAITPRPPPRPVRGKGGDSWTWDDDQGWDDGQGWSATEWYDNRRGAQGWSAPEWHDNRRHGSWRDSQGRQTPSRGEKGKG